MLSLVSPLKLIAAIAIVYALFVVLTMACYMAIVPDVSAWSLIRVVFAVSIVLDAALFVAVHFLWRWVWGKIPILNTLIFPDLNGQWRMEIHWTDPEKKGIVEAMATIRQNFLHISMEVSSGGSDSETLVAIPKKDPESGRPILYYVYRVIPKMKEGKDETSYKGAAILKFEADQFHSLRGNYFTDRKTTGYFELQRGAVVDHNPVTI